LLCSAVNEEDDMDMEKISEDFKNNDFKSVIDNVNGGVVIPAVMYFMGVPLVVVILAWLLFFRG